MTRVIHHKDGDPHNNDLANLEIRVVPDVSPADDIEIATQEEMHLDIPLLPDPYPGSHVESEA